MPAQAKYIPHYSVADYQQWKGAWELWGGIPIAMAPSPVGVHQKAVSRLAHKLWDQIERHGCKTCEVFGELDWIVSNDTVVRPDVSVTCGQAVQRFIEQPPALVVEVISSSTADKDRTVKLDLYERQRVR